MNKQNFEQLPFWKALAIHASAFILAAMIPVAFILVILVIVCG